MCYQFLQPDQRPIGKFIAFFGRHFHNFARLIPIFRSFFPTLGNLFRFFFGELFLLGGFVFFGIILYDVLFFVGFLF